jgi:hypothetical protein
MKWQRGLSVCVGALLAFAVPVERIRATWSHRTTPHEERPTQDTTREEDSDETAQQAFCAETRADTARNLAEIEAFHTEWGTPPRTPPGWDPEAEEARLRATMDRFPSELSAVSCEVYPCVVVMISTQMPTREELTAVFDVPNKAVGLATSRGERDLHTITVASVDTETLDEKEMRWVNRVRYRLVTELGPDVDRLLSQDGPEPGAHSP